VADIGYLHSTHTGDKMSHIPYYGEDLPAPSKEEKGAKK
jgi:hypothetical protein